MSIHYRAKHILLEDLEDAEYVYEKLQDEGLGIFADLAKEFSECESSKKGGSLGTFPQGTMVAEFERALYHMEVGEISKPVKSKFGFHIILKENV